MWRFCHYLICWHQQCLIRKLVPFAYNLKDKDNLEISILIRRYWNYLKNGKDIISLLRWFETVFYFPFQLNFMKGLLVCSKRLLLLVDSRCCNNLSTYQLLYCHWHFGCHGNLTGPQIHPISSIQLHFTQKVVGELPFLLHQNCLHIKEHFLRKFKKILSRGFGATLIFCNIKVA